MRTMIFIIVAITCLVNFSLAQSVSTVSAGATYIASVTGILTNVAFPGKIENLTRGYTYTLNPEPAVFVPVYPVINGAENGIPMTFALSGDLGGFLLMEFSLPTNLIGVSAGNLPCSFNGTSVFVEEDGRRHDPNGAITIQIGQAGIATVDLGITVTVPTNAAAGADTYTGTVTMIASITGI